MDSVVVFWYELLPVLDDYLDLPLHVAGAISCWQKLFCLLLGHCPVLIAFSWHSMKDALPHALPIWACQHAPCNGPARTGHFTLKELLQWAGDICCWWKIAFTRAGLNEELYIVQKSWLLGGEVLSNCYATRFWSSSAVGKLFILGNFPLTLRGSLGLQHLSLYTGQPVMTCIYKHRNDKTYDQQVVKPMSFLLYTLSSGMHAVRGDICLCSCLKTHAPLVRLSVRSSIYQ